MNDLDPPDRLLKLKEVALRMAVAHATVWNWCRKGTLPVIRINSRNFRVRASDLELFLSVRRFLGLKHVPPQEHVEAI